MNKIYREIIELIKDKFRVILIQVNLKFINSLTIKYMNNKLISKV